LRRIGVKPVPFVLIIAGVVLLIAAVRNTQGLLFHLLQGDFVGPHNFVYWTISILIVGAIGYIPKAKPISDGFLILLIVVLFLTKGTGFFDAFQRQISATDSADSNSLRTLANDLNNQLKPIGSLPTIVPPRGRV
jgi:hypothetical protein